VGAGILLFYAGRWADLAGLAVLFMAVVLHFNRSVQDKVA
jgi:hypothetical protein